MKINTITALLAGLGGIFIGNSVALASPDPDPSKAKKTTVETTTTDAEPFAPPATSTSTTTTITEESQDRPPTLDPYVIPAEPTPPLNIEPAQSVVVNTLPAPPAPPAPVVVAPVPQKRILGNSIGVGGGVANFTGGEAASRTDTGGYWDARVVAGTRRVIGAEAAYVGSAQGISSLGLDSNAALVKHGVEGALRVNVPLLTGKSVVAPYGFGGLGYSRYNLRNTSNSATSDVGDADDVMTVPVGAGIAMGADGLLLDARFTYRMTYYNDMFRAGGSDGTNGDLNNWTLGANIGYEF